MSVIRNASLLLLLCIITSGLFCDSASTSDAMTGEEINHFFQQCDAAIDGIDIKAIMTMTFDKDVYNKQQKEKKEFQDSRRRVRPASEMKLAETDFKQVRDLEIIFSGGKTKITHNVHPDLRSETSWQYVDFIEPGKLYSISEGNKSTGAKYVSVDRIDGYLDSFNTQSAHSFGRGLSYFINKKKTLEADGSNPDLYHLKAYINEEFDQYVDLTLDKSKGFCWTSADQRQLKFPPDDN